MVLKRLTYEQEDYLLEEALERWREKKMNICPRCGGTLIKKWYSNNEYAWICKNVCGYYE